MIEFKLNELLFISSPDTSDIIVAFVEKWKMKLYVYHNENMQDLQERARNKFKEKEFRNITMDGEEIQIICDKAQLMPQNIYIIKHVGNGLIYENMLDCMKRSTSYNPNSVR